MEEATKKAYLKLAEHFYKERIAGDVTPKKITDALLMCADEYRPAYWRKLRNALEFDQAEKGYSKAADRIKLAKNPLTLKSAPAMIKAKVKKKERRVKAVADEDHKKIVSYFKEKKDWAVVSALVIANLTGCRPAEMSSIKVLDGAILITGAKKTESNERGLDRTLLFDEKTLAKIKKAVNYINAEESSKEALKTSAMTRIQARLDNGTKALWPRRKSTVTLYSYRHQMGSDLKSSPLDRVDVAYMMGHQATKSVNVYGNRKTASNRSLLKPDLADLAIARGVIRVNHTDKPKEKALVRTRTRTSSNDYSL
jgi:hypothetical protein